MGGISLLTDDVLYIIFNTDVKIQRFYQETVLLYDFYSRGSDKLRKDGRERQFLNNQNVLLQGKHTTVLWSSAIPFVITKVLHLRESG